MQEQEEYTPPRNLSLRRRYLLSLAVALYRHPFFFLFLALALTVLSAWSARDIEISGSLRTYVPAGEEELRAWRPVSLIAPRFAPLTMEIVPRVETDFFDRESRAIITGFFEEALRDVSYLSRSVVVRENPYKPDESYLSYQETILRLRPLDLEPLKRAGLPIEGLGNSLRAVNARLEDAKSRFTEIDQKALNWLAEDPFGVVEVVRERAGDRPGPFPFTMPLALVLKPDENSVLFVLYPIASSSDFRYCVELERFLRSTVEAFQSKPDTGVPEIRVRFHGRHIDTARMARNFRSDIVRVSIILILCLLLLLLLAFRKVESFAFIFIPPLAGWFWTYGLVSLFTDRLGLLSAVFPFVLAALGVEFVVQIYHRFVEGLYREKRYYPALGTAYSEAGRGIIVSTLATALIFASLLFSHFQDLRELALVGMLGTVCMALAALLLLPPLAALKSYFAGGHVEPMETFDFGLGNLSFAVVGSPRTALALCLLVTVYLGYYARSSKLNQTVGLDMTAPQTMEQEFSKRKTPKLKHEERPLSIMVRGVELREALARNDLLYTNLLELRDKWKLGAIRSISPILPGGNLQNAVRRELLNLDLDAVGRSLAYAAEKTAETRKLNMGQDHFRPFIVLFRGLQNYARNFPPLDLATMEDERVLAEARSMLVRDGDGYYLITNIFPEKDSPILLQSGFEEFQVEVGRNLSGGVLRFQGEILQNQQVARTVIFSVALMVFLSILSLAVCLIPHFRWALRDALMAAIPALCAIFWTLGLLSVTNKELGLYSILVLPVVIGIAVNQAVIFIQRLYDREYASLRQVMRAGGKPGVITGFVLVLGLGCLLQVRFQPLREMTSVLLIAAIFTTVSTLILLPAILQIRESGGISGWEGE